MTPKEAIKEIKQTAKPEEPLYIVTTSYASNTFLLPHKAAMQLMDALSHAEIKEYNDIIRPSNEGDYRIEPISRETYYQMKAAQLMQIPFSEFKSLLAKDAA